MINKEEIMQMGVGREIDLLVAERVMGWQAETDEAKLRKLSGYLARDEGRRWWRNPEGGWHCDPPGYSSDIKNGWKVVERMKINGKPLSLFQDFNGNRVAFDQPGAAEPDYIVEKNLLLAICKAALIASV
jgi:hypothetical protein